VNNRAFSLAFIAAAAAVFFVQSYVSSIEQEAQKTYGTENLVVVARLDIKEMDTITENMLELKPIPKKFLEPAAVFVERQNSDKPNKKSSVIQSIAGSVAMVPIKKGEQISFNKITEAGIRTGLSPQVAPGKRAVAISVNEITGVSKLVKPSDRVDIILTGEFGQGKESKLAKTILQDVLVLSIGRYVTNNTSRLIEADPTDGKDKIRSLAEDFSFTSVTVEVDPLQAQILAFLAQSGDGILALALRNNDDSERNPLPAIGYREILGGDFARTATTRK
jgi:pilus assembly protein CpaB